MSSEEYIEGTKGFSFPNGWPKSAEIKKYVGGCHCGKFRYETEFPSLERAPVIKCDCTSCSQKGSMVMYVVPRIFLRDCVDFILTSFAVTHPYRNSTSLRAPSTNYQNINTARKLSHTTSAQSAGVRYSLSLHPMA